MEFPRFPDLEKLFFWVAALFLGLILTSGAAVVFFFLWLSK